MIDKRVGFALMIIVLISLQHVFSQDQKNEKYWDLSAQGGIVWDISNTKNLPHSDNIELSGSKVSAIVDYEINKKKQLRIKRDIIFPQLRTYDQTNGVSWQNFRAYRRLTYSSEIEPNITENIKNLVFDQVDSVQIDGKLVFYHTPVNGIMLTRSLFPSMTDRLFVEEWTLTNLGDTTMNLNIGNSGAYTQIAGYKGIYHNKVYSDAPESIALSPGGKSSFAIYFGAAINDEPIDKFDFKLAEKGRDEFLQKMRNNLVLETNNPVLDRLFYFSKIRASESIFESKLGMIHSPGGGNYYVGIWANDQVEYSGPFFPFLGYDQGIIAAENAYNMFLKHIPSDDKPIPYSFEIEGDVKSTNKDRGDAAMIAYGTSLYSLRIADRKVAKELWPLIEWSIEYCDRKLNKEGVVLSKTDEMEGRLPTGDANLATSALYYGALKYAAYLASQLGYTDRAKTYKQRQKALEKNIEAYFGYTIEGLNTYRYFEGNKQLRHWISLPMVMGINTRAEETTKALLDKLWTANGVLVEHNPTSPKNPVFWDRGTLYVLRGTFKAGYVDKSIEKLAAFSEKRLLGERVPYVVEAYPENGMRHLSAESALYCRVFIEGILGLEQTGFSTLSITPHLSQQLSKLNLKNIYIGNQTISIALELIGSEVKTRIELNGKLIVDSKNNNGSRTEFSIK